MRDETPELPAPLRSGYTTGSCATATSLAAARLLLGGLAFDAVEIVQPKGQQVLMRLGILGCLSTLGTSGIVPAQVRLEVFAIDRQGRIAGQAQESP